MFVADQIVKVKEEIRINTLNKNFSPMKNTRGKLVTIKKIASLGVYEIYENDYYYVNEWLEVWNNGMFEV